MNTSTPANADEQFEIVREAVLSERKPDLYSIQSSGGDGGYIVTGAIIDSQAWAARLDAEGRELWSYLIPKDTPPDDRRVTNLWHASTFRGGVALPKGNTLLCGSKDIGEENDPTSTRGLLTKIDEKGQVLDQRLLLPHGDTNFRFNHFSQCAPWGDGYFVAGGTTQHRPNVPGKLPRNIGQHFFWLTALDAQGEIKWEKYIPKEFYTSEADQLPWLVMANGDLVFSSGFHKYIGTQVVTSVIRIGQDGEVKAFRTIEGAVKLVRQPNPAQAIRLVPRNLEDSGMFLLTLNDDLSDATRLKAESIKFGASQAIEMADHSIVLVGNREFRIPYAAVIRYSPDLTRSQDYVFKPKGASAWVNDAMLTGKPHELAVVRAVDSGTPARKNLFTILQLK